MSLRQLVLGLSIALTALAVSGARAEPADLKDARRHFSTGMSHAEGGRWDLALDSFKTAYALAPRPAVLFNLAGAQFRSGQLLASIANYRRFVAIKDPTLTGTHKRAAEQQIKRIEDRIPRLRVLVDGLRADDRVLLDKTRLYPNELDLELWVDPGVHQVSVYRTNGQEEIRSVGVTEGEHRILSFHLP